MDPGRAVELCQAPNPVLSFTKPPPKAESTEHFIAVLHPKEVLDTKAQTQQPLGRVGELFSFLQAPHQLWLLCPVGHEDRFQSAAAIFSIYQLLLCFEQTILDKQ